MQVALDGGRSGVHSSAVRELFTQPGVVALTAGLSVAIFVLGLVLVPVVVARLPADYFARDRKSSPPRPSLARTLLRTLKNVLGAALVLAGVAMLVLPGQGVITILAGLSLLEFPGKHKLERRLLQQRTVRRFIGRIRKRAGREPLRF